MKILKFSLRVSSDATAGTYDLDVATYRDGEKFKIRKSFSLDVKNKESAEVIHIDRTSLKPGELSPLSFTVNNVGNAPLRDLTFTWSNADKAILPVGSDNSKYIKTLNVGESARLDYQVIADI